MISRCTKLNDSAYPEYGGRGITVCDWWQGDDGFAHFVEDMGDRPNEMTLDRIDNNVGYTKKNCRWATRKMQGRNRRGCVSDEVRGRIAARLASGCSEASVIAQFGVDRGVVRRIKHTDAPQGPAASHPLYSLWTGILRRCRHNLNYGARGITVCPRWQGSGNFWNFVADIGPRPSLKHSVDRIDNNGNYCAATCGGLCGHATTNCRWAVHSLQMLNRRDVRQFTVDETTEIVAAIASGESMSSVGRRFAVTWPVIKRVCTNVHRDERVASPQSTCATDLDLRAVSYAEVSVLFEQHHAYAGASSLTTYCFAVFEHDRPVAAFTWAPTTPGPAQAVCPEEPSAVLALSRMVAIPKVDRVLKHISKPLRVQMHRLIDRTRWPVLITYSDEGLGHTGHVYKCSGWEKTDRNLRSQYVNANGVRTSSYVGGRHDVSGLTSIGSAFIQRWEHWACPRGDAAQWLQGHGWTREAVPGKVWRSGNPAFRWIRLR